MRIMDGTRIPNQALCSTLQGRRRDIGLSMKMMRKRSRKKKDCLHPEVKILSVFTVYLRSRNSHWLRAGRRRGRSSSPGRGTNILCSTSSGLVLGPTQPLI
jgi:hypothetical protein